jgi:hypothetical protein
MSFDEWTLDGKAWYLYGANASDAQKNVWGTANKGTSILGKSTTSPEETFVAVKGTGKKAAKLISTYLAVKFAAGNLFNGQFVGLKGFTGAELAWGTPFTAKPNHFMDIIAIKEPLSIMQITIMPASREQWTKVT